MPPASTARTVGAYPSYRSARAATSTRRIPVPGPAAAESWIRSVSATTRTSSAAFTAIRAWKTVAQSVQSPSRTATRLHPSPGPGRTDAGAGRPTSVAYPDRPVSPEAASRPRTRAYTATRATSVNAATSSARRATASATDIPVPISARPASGEHRQRVDDLRLGHRQRGPSGLGPEQHEVHAKRRAREDVAPLVRAPGDQSGRHAVQDAVGAPQLAAREGEPGPLGERRQHLRRPPDDENGVGAAPDERDVGLLHEHVRGRDEGGAVGGVGEAERPQQTLDPRSRRRRATEPRGGLVVRAGEDERGVRTVGGLEHHGVVAAHRLPHLPAAGQDLVRDRPVLARRGEEELPCELRTGEAGVAVPAEVAEHRGQRELDGVTRRRDPPHVASAVARCLLCHRSRRHPSSWSFGTGPEGPAPRSLRCNEGNPVT